MVSLPHGLLWGKGNPHSWCKASVKVGFNKWTLCVLEGPCLQGRNNNRSVWGYCLESKAKDWNRDLEIGLWCGLYTITDKSHGTTEHENLQGVQITFVILSSYTWGNRDLGVRVAKGVSPHSGWLVHPATRCFIWDFSFHPHIYPFATDIIVPILQIRKVRLSWGNLLLVEEPGFKTRFSWFQISCMPSQNNLLPPAWKPRSYLLISMWPWASISQSIK